MTDASRTRAQAKPTKAQAKAPAKGKTSKAPSAPTKRKTGRPSLYTPEIAERICDGLANGIPLTVICAEPGMPAERTVHTWAAEKPDLSAAIAGARDLGYDKIALDALRIADSPAEGKRIKRSEDGTEEVIEDMLGHRKLQVETRLKLLAKWDPRRYGDKTTTELTGPGGGAIQHSLAVRFVSGEGSAANAGSNKADSASREG